MKIDSDARYAESHEWVRQEGELMVYGITDHAQDQLSDLVYVEIPAVGDHFDQGDIIGVIESVKAASDLYLPMGGEIVATNEILEESPEVLNTDPYGEGWIAKFKPADPGQWDDLLTPEAYEQFVGEE
ncbi:MAG: glycine cleavage system protein GcvH [Anaerolineales bacterium]|nr:glycine cleavage system protein GcvH [Anaerolineales bacterium]